MNHEGSCSRIWFLSTSSTHGNTKEIWPYLKSKGSPIPLQNHLTSPSQPKLGKETGTVDYQIIWNQLAVLMLTFLPDQFVTVPNLIYILIMNHEACEHGKDKMVGRMATAGYYRWGWATPKKNKDRSSIYVTDQQNHKTLKFYPLWWGLKRDPQHLYSYIPNYPTTHKPKQKSDDMRPASKKPCKGRYSQSNGDRWPSCRWAPVV